MALFILFHGCWLAGNHVGCVECDGVHGLHPSSGCAALAVLQEPVGPAQGALICAVHCFFFSPRCGLLKGQTLLELLIVSWVCRWFLCTLQIDLPPSAGGVDDLGLTLATTEFGVIVAAVADESIAEQQGLVIGDCIVQVCAASASSLL